MAIDYDVPPEALRLMLQSRASFADPFWVSVRTAFCAEGWTYQQHAVLSCEGPFLRLQPEHGPPVAIRWRFVTGILIHEL